MNRTSIEWTHWSANPLKLRIPGDVLLKISSHDLAYMAGILDGEGCFRIGRVGPAKVTWYPTIEIGMTDRPLIEWLQTKWQSGTIKLNNHTQLRRNPQWKPQYMIRIHGRRAQLLCTLLLPYLKVKLEHARLILQFPAGACGKPLTEETQAKRFSLFEKIRALNKRGPLAA